MHISTGEGWHYGGVRAPAELPVVSPARRPHARRTIALAAAVSVTTGALSACTAEEPEPDAALVDIVHQLDALDGTDVAGGTALFADQAEALDAEILRLCGTDRDGEIPESCTTGRGESTGSGSDDTDETPSVSEVRDSMMVLIGTDGTEGSEGPGDYPGAASGDDARDRAVLLSGLYAALATLEDSDAGGSAIDQDVLDGGFPSASEGSVDEATAEALTPVTELVNQAIYLSGAVLPVSGENRGTVTVVSERMRTLRDAVTSASGVPGEVGYAMPEDFSAPSGATSAVETLLPAVHAVTVSLRAAVDEVDEADRAVVAMWTAVSARSEAALEDALGTDPLATSIRGE